MKRVFRVEIRSPYGKRPTEQFRKHLSDMASESLERWGIEISITEIEETTEDVSKDEFQ